MRVILVPSDVEKEVQNQPHRKNKSDNLQRDMIKNPKFASTRLTALH